MTLYDRIQETTKFLQNRIKVQPTIGIILGSGLGGLEALVESAESIAYSEIPHFPQSTVEGHAGRLIFGKLEGKQVVMMVGRFHYYEGYSQEEVTFPVRVMKALGAKMLLVSNAAGGLNRSYEVGDIVLIKDHINLLPEHPLRGINDERLGLRFPDMSEPYDLPMIALAEKIALTQNLKLKTGVYAGVQGPTFETRAEYEWLRGIGADLVGMSTVAEVIVAIHGGMNVFGASIVTDIGIREERNTITHYEVLEVANAAAPKLARLVKSLVEEL
ncbi:MAG: purine-nucleoside phosphorylase [Chitinophagaceae bacterium]